MAPASVRPVLTLTSPHARARFAPPGCRYTRPNPGTTIRRPTPAIRYTPVSWTMGPETGLNPYVGYSRRFTAEGGIEISYTCLGEHFLPEFIRALLWLGAVGLSLAYSWHDVPLPVLPASCRGRLPCSDPMVWAHLGFHLAMFVTMAVSAYWALFDDVHDEHTIEVRKDCLILDGEDVFWRAHILRGSGTPGPGPDGTLVLKTIYGTRYVELQAVRRIDPDDRTPDVLFAHLADAINQLWQDDD